LLYERPLASLYCVPTSAAIDLTLRTRDSASRILTTNEPIDPAKTGLVIIDMWNTNDCMTNAQPRRPGAKDE
jgi:hypothetical protein